MKTGVIVIVNDEKPRKQCIVPNTKSNKVTWSDWRLERKENCWGESGVKDRKSEQTLLGPATILSLQIISKSPEEPVLANNLGVTASRCRRVHW